MNSVATTNRCQMKTSRFTSLLRKSAFVVLVMLPAVALFQAYAFSQEQIADKKGASTMMPLDKFWEIIETSKDDDQKNQLKLLNEKLRPLSDDELLTFIWRFDDIDNALDRYDLWDVAYLVRGGCSDDAFMDFRKWLISKGRLCCEKVLDDPQNVVEFAANDDCTFEEFGRVGLKEYKRRRIGKLATPFSTKPTLDKRPIPFSTTLGTKGTPISGSDDQKAESDYQAELEKRYPRVAKWAEKKWAKQRP